MLSMTYVEKISIYMINCNCVNRVIATEPERVYRKDSSITIPLVFYIL